MLVGWEAYCGGLNAACSFARSTRTSGNDLTSAAARFSSSSASIAFCFFPVIGNPAGDSNQPRVRFCRPPFFAEVVLGVEARFDFTLRFGFAFGRTLSGNLAFPAARFHSSKVSGEILPLSNNSANFLRCDLLLIGI